MELNLNEFTSKIYNKLIRQLNLMTQNDMSIRPHGILSINKYMLYLHTRSISIVNAKMDKDRVYRIKDELFDIEMIVHIDLRITLNISVIKKSTETLNSDFMISAISKMSGYVYFIKSDFGYKIGMTSDIKKRLQTFSVKLPFAFSLHSYAQSNRYSELEKSLHLAISDKRINGEWFLINEDDWRIIDFIIEKNGAKRILQN
jgi:hypothetical protein